MNDTVDSKTTPRILCIGMPVRDLAFRVDGVPERGFKIPAAGFEEIAGGNALNASIGIVRLGGRASLTGPMGDAGETSSRYIFDKLTDEGIETNRLIQGAGREWRALRNGPVTQLGGWFLVLVLAAILLFYFIKGTIRLKEPRTGRLIERFNAVERVSHWTMAISFIFLALTGSA